jgi:hypothetical protein
LYIYGELNSIKKIDPEGLLSTLPWPTGSYPPQDLSPCEYYNNRCSATGCGYYCNIAPYACKYIDFVPTYWGMSGGEINCVRRCLVRRDSEESQDERSTDCDGCVKPETIDQYHVDCFIECDVNSCRYPGINRPFPCRYYDPS